MFANGNPFGGSGSAFGKIVHLRYTPPIPVPQLWKEGNYSLIEKKQTGAETVLL